MHETVDVVLELHKDRLGVSEGEISSQIHWLLSALRDDIGKQIDTTYDEHKLCASSRPRRMVALHCILQWTDDDHASSRGFMEVGYYKTSFGWRPRASTSASERVQACRAWSG